MHTSKPQKAEMGKTSRKSWDSDSFLGVAHEMGGSVTPVCAFKMGEVFCFRRLGWSEMRGAKLKLEKVKRESVGWISGKTFDYTSLRRHPLWWWKQSHWLANPEILSISEIVHLFNGKDVHCRNKKCQEPPFFNRIHLVLKLGTNYCILREHG